MNLFFFFFQAEDGIRDSSVTGVQTCALPISPCAQREITPLLLVVQNLLQNCLMKQVELGLITEKAGFVDRQVFYQRGEFAPAFVADEQPVITVERIQAGSFEPALKPVL